MPIPFASHAKERTVVKAITNAHGDFQLRGYTALALIVSNGIETDGGVLHAPVDDRSKHFFNFHKNPDWDLLPQASDRRLTYVLKPPSQ